MINAQSFFQRFQIARLGSRVYLTRVDFGYQSCSVIPGINERKLKQKPRAYGVARTHDIARERPLP